MLEEAASDERPPRPPHVPKDAVWIPDLGRWELAAVDAAGVKYGAYSQWRPDGSLYGTGHYEAGVLSGPFQVFHPSGELAREGHYQGGDLDGLLVAYESASVSPEGLRPCCVPAGAWSMRARYQGGQLTSELFLDKEGRALLSDGSLRPSRPAGLPEDATFDEYSRRWTCAWGSEAGTMRFWSLEGALVEEARYENGTKAFSRLFDAREQPYEETNLDQEGRFHGRRWRRFLDEGQRPYEDRRIRGEEGTCSHGQATGIWTFFDEEGQVVRTVDRGVAFDQRDWRGRDVFRDDERDGAAWIDLAESLAKEHRTREALCAVARAVGAGVKVATLVGWLQTVTVPLLPEAQARVSVTLSSNEEGILEKALDLLIVGGDPVLALKTIALQVGNANRAAYQFIQAAIALDPRAAAPYVSRALIRIELGDPEGARSDAEVVAGNSPESATFLRDYVRVLFPRFDFWPKDADIPDGGGEDLPGEPAQPLDAVRRTIQVYATRLSLIRARIATLAPDGSRWLPPDPNPLLPQGPVALRAETATIVDETDEGPEESQVEIQEALDLTGWSVPALMRLARVQWVGLCWTCWCAGGNEVGLPNALKPPARFRQAVAMAVARHWRAQDAVVTSGLRSLTAGVPGFAWEGIDIEGISKLFAEMATDEYLEMRSVFLWLMSSENLSPFQSDLRQA